MIFIIEIARSSGLAGITFHLRLEGKKRFRMSCFFFNSITKMNSVKYNFIMLKNEMESYVRITGEELEKSYVPLHGDRGGSKIAKIILTLLMNGP